MEYRRLGKTGFEISSIGLGTWQVGGKWGDKFSHVNAAEILDKAIDEGINFIDTADVYGDRESEKAVGNALKRHKGRIYVATKCGRRLNPHTDEAYTVKALRGFVEDSLHNMDLECLDLIQLHCPPNDTYYRPEIFGLFEKLKEEGKILNLGVSVEKVEQAIKAMEYPNVTTVQIIFNMFRQRPSELFFDLAKKNNVGIIARVPLVSGLLTGKFTKDTEFESGDHRHENRNGEHFDKGETFSGVDYDLGIDAAEELARYFGRDHMAQIALQWILMFPEVSTVIPGASKVEQVESNLKTYSMDDLTPEDMDFVRKIYEKYIKSSVHQLW